MIEPGYLKKLNHKLNRPLVLDGAVGSLLKMKGLPIDLFLWTSELSITHPEEVSKIHQDYIHSGSDIITTNTFRSNPVAYSKNHHSYTNDFLVKRNVKLATDLEKNHDVLVAGSNAPAEDCYQVKRTISLKELEYNHKTHIDLLIVAGCDFILNETQSHWDEIKIICEHCSINKIPFIVSLYFTDDLKILSGEKVYDVMNNVLEYQPETICFNCIKPSTFEKLYKQYQLPMKSSFYFNCGLSNIEEEEFSAFIPPMKYSQLIKDFLNLDPLIIGSCCGSNSSHTLSIRDTIRELYRN